MSKQIFVSKDGYLKLQNELEHLKTVKRAEVAQAIKKARSFGDLSENSEYDEAKNEQAEIETKIAQLEETIKNATPQRVWRFLWLLRCDLNQQPLGLRYPTFARASIHCPRLCRPRPLFKCTEGAIMRVSAIIRTQ